VGKKTEILTLCVVETFYQFKKVMVYSRKQLRGLFPPFFALMP